MKRLFPIFPILIYGIAVFFLFLSCGRSGSSAGEEAETPSGVQALPEQVQPQETQGDYAPLQEENLTPRVPVGSNESLLRVLNVNLDLDRQEEQILVLRDKDSVNSYIRLAVLDYDNVLKDYRRTWQDKTEITSIRGFNITLQDLIGDHNLEIICSGVSLEGKQSLTVFRKTKGDNGTGLNYSEIFNHQANGAIEILEVARTRAYESGMRDGESFPIITTVQDPESENMMDLIRNTYYWDFPSRHYIKVNEEKILGRQLEEEQLRQLYRSSDEDFISHINGPWMKNDGSRMIIDINRKTQRITFFSEEIQEVYIWTSSYRILSNVMRLDGENELINHVENEITVRLSDLNSLLITVRDIDTQTRLKTPNDFWTGQYFFLTDELRNDLNGQLPVHSVPALYGKYLGDTGEELDFTGTTFDYTSSDESFNGGYSLFFADEDIFSMRIFDRFGIPVETRTYRYEFEETRQDNTIQRTLTLHRGQLLIYGFEPFDQPRLRFRQTEIIEDETAENPEE